MRALSSLLRRQLETSVLAARRVAEGASRASLEGLGVFLRDKPGHLDADQAALRNGLRAKWRQLGEDRDLLIAECAYEQWHRLLFARFLADNNLLLHPKYKAPVTLSDCDELASDLGEPDGWSVAARFAAEILPGIFRLDDPCFRLRLAPEGRHELEQILDALPDDVFAADDALGWVYQFWQKDKKDEVNGSERKVGGADLAAVTQLFTENYMVRFLLENSLGAWWAARHADSPLVKGLDYLRFGGDGKPAAGLFESWPDRVADVTVMDPCCGSGHFLIEAFSMLWQMRAEEERLAPVDAQDAVLRDNLFGLELDPRCVQIAMFNVALQAWKAGSGWRQLPVPNIACSGLPVKAPVEEWKALAGGDPRVANALVRLHILFRYADTLGSLIDPKRAAEISDPTGLQTSLEDVDWDSVAPLLRVAASAEAEDPASAVLGADAVGMARAADFLGRRYTLTSTNVPYLLRRRQSEVLADELDRRYALGSGDIATAFLLRSLEGGEAGSCALVLPTSWTATKAYEGLRQHVLRQRRVNLLARLGAGAFRQISGEVVNVGLLVASREQPDDESRTAVLDVSGAKSAEAKATSLKSEMVLATRQIAHLASPSSRIMMSTAEGGELLSAYCHPYQGTTTGDNSRWTRQCWELSRVDGWMRFQGTVVSTRLYGGRRTLLWWGDQGRVYEQNPGARLQGQDAWGRTGVSVAQMGDLPATLFTGGVFDMNSAVLVPFHDGDLSAIWAFCSSPDYHLAVRQLDSGIKVTNATLGQVRFDVEEWRRIAAEQFPNGMPEPFSNDPTQWLFDGRPEVSTAPLQVAVARLLGYRWPGQAESDDLDPLADVDGIVCLPSVAGEAPAADRLQRMLAAAYKDSWSPTRVKELLDQEGSRRKNIDDWLRDEYFKRHCALFGNRPFVWHVWDGLRDGFSALVNYHRLDRKMLEKLTYTCLGQDWVERQRAGVRDEVVGAEARLSAALELQRRLEAILEGEKPFDIFVRWKDLYEQPIGWEPDVNDGVRLNIRPFVEARVLRAPPNIHWRKDRGKNPDGTERENDAHVSLDKKSDARKRIGRT